MTTWKVLHGAIAKSRDILYGLVGLGVDSDFSDAPGGDLNLDDIFGDASSQQTTAGTKPNEPQETVEATTPAEPVIKTKTGTVYKTIGDAVEGIEHKDALIAQLRNQVQQQTGNDPLVARREEPKGPVSYLDNQEQYFEDIAKAVNNKDTKGYMEAQRKLIYDSLGPIAPTLSALSRANAERVVSNDLPEFKGYLGSDDYRNLASEAPLLADAIKQAEMNPAAAQQLPELYKIAYLATQGRRLPELIQSARSTATQVSPRPTVHSTSIPPPATTGQTVVQPTLQTKEGRKALIDQMEQRGVGDLKW